ncbi:MerC family mercury resistance protein [Kiloniella majae]|uniref:MerC family mercury resistance protein n=1 Tax=Kiloniella majae TaxID=1938558 RepID=UPI000A279039|nr:MerC family mercury resistance protein [Kiloniella majae]
MSPDDGSTQHNALNYKAQNQTSHEALYQAAMHPGSTRPRISLIASAATTCSIILCYGTLILINLFGKMGFEITVNETLWAGAITIASLFAILGLFANLFRHKHFLPLIMGCLGCGLVNFVMHFDDNMFIEFTGFACLCLAAVLDWRALKRN